MKRMSRRTAKHLSKTILLLWACSMLISTTGCSPRYVVVNGDETVPVKKSDLDRLYQDNELLIKGLQDCQGDK